MSFTYDTNQLSEPLNRLRLLVSDTDANDYLLEDEEINFIFSSQTGTETEANIYRAAAQAARLIAGKLAQMPNIEDSAIKFDAASRAKTYRTIAEDYDSKALAVETLAEKTTAENTAGSYDLMAKCTAYDDCEPAFTRDLHLS